MARFLSASYEKLIEEFYKADKSKLETALESDAKEILNDANMRNLLKEFILRIDKDSNWEPNSMIACRYFEHLSTIHTLEDFNATTDQFSSFGLSESDLKEVHDESALYNFLRIQKVKCYRKVDDSIEYLRFKEYLKRKYQTRRRR